VAVCCLERLCDLLRDRQRLVERQRAACDAIGKRRPVDELERQGNPPVGLLEPVDRADVRMVE
jgi:hypothetical protein